MFNSFFLFIMLLAFKHTHFISDLDVLHIKLLRIMYNVVFQGIQETIMFIFDQYIFTKM